MPSIYLGLQQFSVGDTSIHTLLAEDCAGLTGGDGHAQPFTFTPERAPHAGIDRMLVGTAAQSRMIALEESLSALAIVDLAALRAKRMALADLSIAIVDRELAGHGFGIASPREAAQRGSEVALRDAVAH